MKNWNKAKAKTTNFSGLENQETEKELVRDLKIPPEWIHEIKANAFADLKLHWQQYRHLTLTEKWSEAHDVAIHNLIPSLIGNEHYDEAKKVLYPIATGAPQIPNWKTQGGLILDYLQLRDILGNRSDYPDVSDLDLNEDLVALLQKIPEYPSDEATMCMCISELSKQCAFLVKRMCEDDTRKYKWGKSIAPVLLRDLILPHDYKMDEAITTLYRTTEIDSEDDEAMVY